MHSAENGELAEIIARHLPYLRRYARALTGRQETGDECVAATLQVLVDDPGALDRKVETRIALFRLFHATWLDAGTPIRSPASSEGGLAARAQKNLEALPLGARAALLLHGIEDFAPAEVAQVMQLGSESEAADLIATGRRDMERQTAGRILIIEDEPIIAMDLKAIVTNMGHEVTGIAATRDRAVLAARDGEPNLVLADIKLADGSSGIDAVREILASTRVPVIFITAYPERLLTGERPEPTFLITKPFREEHVRTAISQALFFETVLDSE